MRSLQQPSNAAMMNATMHSGEHAHQERPLSVNGTSLPATGVINSVPSSPRPSSSRFESGLSGAVVIVVCFLLLLIGLASVLVKTCLRHRRRREELAMKEAASRRQDEPLPGRLHNVDSYFNIQKAIPKDEVIVELQPAQSPPKLQPALSAATVATSCSTPTDGPACAICLEEYESHDVVRLLPCKHHFHQSCVDEWLDTQAMVCPMCRTDLHTLPPAQSAKRLHWPTHLSLVACFGRRGGGSSIGEQGGAPAVQPNAPVASDSEADMEATIQSNSRA